MNVAEKIVTALLETDEFDPKEFVLRNDILPNPRITTTFSTVTWDDTGDPDGYEEEHGYEDEEGQEVEVDEFDREEGLDVADLAAKWLRNNGVIEASSSQFYPGVWYSDEPHQDMHTGASTTKSFHLQGFRPEEEEKIFYLLFPRRAR